MQCVITKWDGNRCDNLTDSDEAYLCSRHAVQHAESKPDDPAFKHVFEQIERGVKFAGSVAGLTGGMIKIAEFVIEHHARLFVMFGASHRREGSEREARQIEIFNTSVTKLKEGCNQLLHSESPSQEDLQALLVSFDDWFEGLPVQIRRDAKRHFGELYFEAIRNSLASSKPDSLEP